MSDRQQIALDIANDLNQVEMAIDAAIAAAGGLVSRLPAYRSEASLSAVAGQDVFVALCEAATLLANARGAVVRGHNGLDDLRRRMRMPPVRTTAIGAADKPPSFADVVAQRIEAA